jgi:ABC-type polysaccharide/polyol phosphate export permease
MLTALGIVCALAALNVRYRDVRQVVTPALQVLLLVSPVAYSYSTVSGTAGLLIALNPVVGALELGRWVLIGADWPGLAVARLDLLLPAGSPRRGPLLPAGAAVLR